MKQSISVRVVRIAITYGFLLIGSVLLVQRDYLTAIMAICLGSGLWLSVDTDVTMWYRRPHWQRVLAVALVLLGLALFIVQFMRDLGA